MVDYASDRDNRPERKRNSENKTGVPEVCRRVETPNGSIFKWTGSSWLWHLWDDEWKVAVAPKQWKYSHR